MFDAHTTVYILGFRCALYVAHWRLQLCQHFIFWRQTPEMSSSGTYDGQLRRTRSLARGRSPSKNLGTGTSRQSFASTPPRDIGLYTRGHEMQLCSGIALQSLTAFITVLNNTIFNQLRK